MNTDLFWSMGDYDEGAMTLPEWNEAMTKAVEDYNNDHNTNYVPEDAVRDYLEWKMERMLAEEDDD